MRNLALLVGLTISAAALVGGACTTPDKSGGTAVSKGARDCAGASLAIADDVVIGTFDGKPVTYGEMGKELADAEKKALHQYCDGVYAARTAALDNYITEKLVAKAAAAAGQAEDEWMRAEVMKRVGTPSDEEIAKFYNERKRPDAPPLEAVRDQVAMMIQREKSEEAVRSLIDDLKKGSTFKASLPDVRSPPREVDVPAHTATKGKAGAKVRVVEFADFQCPYCSKAADGVKELEKKYGDRVEFAYRHFPLRSIHPEAQKAAEFTQCAKAQGKFWELHDKLYSGVELDEASLKKAAGEVGLDTAKLDECIASGKGAAEVEEDLKKAETLGVEGTPTFFVNGRQHLGGVETLAASIEAAL